MIRSILYILLLFISLSNALWAQERADSKKKQKVYQFELNDEIGPGSWRKMQQALAEAKTENADIFLIHMNTYGGALVAADSMRTAILQYPIPTYVFIDNNAASAGALISIACDSIYMRPGANIGAATVVNGTDGQAMPDKYQSYMRSMMRATAEAHGGDTINKNGKQIIKWRRNPAIAEAMVDDRLAVPNVIDSGKTLTFTTNEAILHGFCEAKAESVEEILQRANVINYEIKNYEPTALQNIISFLVNPILQSVLIMLLIGGIWFELQSPGIGFPLAVAGLAALLYFMPLILEGLAAYWEIALFILGVILLLVEFLIIPGFGVPGIIGSILIFIGLVLSMVDTLDFDFNPTQSYNALLQAVFQISISFIVFMAIAFTFGSTFFRTKAFQRIALNTQMKNDAGYISTKNSLRNYIGKEGIVFSDLRPSGSIEVDGEYLDAVAISGLIPKGEKIIVKKYTMGQLYVEEV
ncbi:membrane-bound serine protease (ClpP class) [Balneicella halophila]|uniref:Membrane-bound serine protease (ClpP class) n=1 Tax=Balneicella halophila TaxID=1537566 RepID=A0A7L4UQB1_BALHA|nr:NfeD family protein [Balneicella halophila]PVX51965.1 membrane-bound serine protease (ClpP class) [Balneicella halophila]